MKKKTWTNTYNIWRIEIKPNWNAFVISHLLRLTRTREKYDRIMVRKTRHEKTSRKSLRILFECTFRNVFFSKKKSCNTTQTNERSRMFEQRRELKI